MSPATRFASCLLAAGLCLPALAGAADDCAKVEVSGRPASKPANGGEVTLAATAVEDVVFDVKLANDILGEHVLTLNVYLPEGGLYQSLSVPVEAGTKARDRQRRVEGYPFPLDVVTATAITSGPDSGKRKLDITMPLAGSAIVSNSLYGSWGVELFLDDAAEPCVERVAFVIEP
jgi:hypothetical protein